VNKQDLYVSVTGAGPDLVLLHGWAMHGGVFAGVIDELSQHYRVHCIDLPGHGRSTTEFSSTDLNDLADVIAPLIPEHAVLLGWSLGGLLALALTQRIALRALVLVNSSPRFVANEQWPHGMAPAVFAQFFARLQQNMQGTVQDFLRLQVRGDSHAAETFATLQASLTLHPASAQTLQRGLALLRNADASAVLGHVQAPTLVIAGEYDRITHPEACAQLARELPNASLISIKRAGHAPFISHRDEFLATVQDFLSSVVNEVVSSG
jgi:pimeloyl-[acyl-carrier protein] methyl ester esterase